MECYYEILKQDISAKSLEYTVDDSRFVLNYQKLRDDYVKFKAMDDEEFVKNLPDVLHFASFVVFFKNVPTEVVHSDKGVIHNLIHLLATDTKDDPIISLPYVRSIFNEICELA